MTWLVVFAVWFAGWIWTAGTLIASERAEFTSLNSYRDDRSRIAANLLLSILPPAWIIAVALTGFYQDGWANPFKVVGVKVKGIDRTY